MTRHRQNIIEVLQKADIPLNTSQVHKRCPDKPDLATVYRNLQALENGGQAESFVFDCDDTGVERYYIKSGDSHRHYLHCRECHQFFPLHFCPLDTVLKEVEENHNFTILQHFFTIKGICGACKGL